MANAVVVCASCGVSRPEYFMSTCTLCGSHICGLEGCQSRCRCDLQIGFTDKSLADMGVSANDVITFVKDANGTYVACDEAASRLFDIRPGYSDLDVVGDLDMYATIRHGDEMALEFGEHECVLTLPTARGAQHWLVRKFAVTDDHGKTFVSGFACNITASVNTTRMAA